MFLMLGGRQFQCLGPATLKLLCAKVARLVNGTSSVAAVIMANSLWLFWGIVNVDHICEILWRFIM